MFVIKKFQTTCLILLADCAKDNVPYLLATAANRSRIKRESEYNNSRNLGSSTVLYVHSVWVRVQSVGQDRALVEFGLFTNSAYAATKQQHSRTLEVW